MLANFEKQALKTGIIPTNEEKDKLLIVLFNTIIDDFVLKLKECIIMTENVDSSEYYSTFLQQFTKQSKCEISLKLADCERFGCAMDYETTIGSFTKVILKDIIKLFNKNEYLSSRCKLNTEELKVIIYETVKMWILTPEENNELQQINYF